MAMQKLDYSQCSFTVERLQELVAEHRMLEWTQTKMSLIWPRTHIQKQFLSGVYLFLLSLSAFPFAGCGAQVTWFLR